MARIRALLSQASSTELTLTCQGLVEVPFVNKGLQELVEPAPSKVNELCWFG